MNESAATSAERNSFCAMIIIIIIKVHMRECSSGCGGCSAVLLAGERHIPHLILKSTSIKKATEKNDRHTGKRNDYVLFLCCLFNSKKDSDGGVLNGSRPAKLMTPRDSTSYI